jgi:hypothetical protein
LKQHDQIYSDKKTYEVYPMNTMLLSVGVISILLVSVFITSSPIIEAEERTITWESTLFCNESSGLKDYVIFGEAPDAHDGPPSDSYDAVKPPAPPMPPYIRAYLKDNLSVPYNQLWEDYRQYPGTQKTWKLTVQWAPENGESPSDVTINWNPALIHESEYTSVNLCTSTGTVLRNMLMDTTYSFACPAYVLQNFKIICSTGSNQPPEFGIPTPANDSKWNLLNLTWSIPISDPEGDPFSWMIQCNNGQVNRGSGALNGTKSLMLSDLAYLTTYKVWVNATDPTGSKIYTRRWYSFTLSQLNTPPVADASASEHLGSPGASLIFNGSRSHDPDGYITAWSWVYGDSTNGTGEITNHIYNKTGTFQVTLTVTDNAGATNSDTLTVQIVTQNHSPTQPVINGTTRGIKNKTYTFTISSIDADNDFIQYTVTWGDGTHNMSAFLPNGTPSSVSHSWKAAGKYLLAAIANDSQTESTQGSLSVFIDVYFIGDTGFLYDANGDTINDSFFSNTTNSTTKLQRLTDGRYRLDTNADGQWDVIYDPATGNLTTISGNGINGINQNILSTLIGGVSLIIVVIALYIFMRKRGKK